MKQLRSTEVPPVFELRNLGLGTLRSSGTYIGLLLQLEDDRDRIPILVEVIRELGINLDELVDYYHAIVCDRCASTTSPLHPCECDREMSSGYPTPSNASKGL